MCVCVCVCEVRVLPSSEEWVQVGDWVEVHGGACAMLDRSRLWRIVCRGKCEARACSKVSRGIEGHS